MFNGNRFQFDIMKKFWGRMVVMVVQQCEELTALNFQLKMEKMVIFMLGIFCYDFFKT